jgi:hypothetical protein
MKQITKAISTLVCMAVIPILLAGPKNRNSSLVEVDLPSKTHGENYEEYWEIMATGKTVKDLRPVKPSDSTDLREFALSLPIQESRTESHFAFVYKHSEPAPDAKTWIHPADGAQYPAKITRLKPGDNGAQRIEVEMGLWRGAPMTKYIHIAKLERREGGWQVLDGRLLSAKGEQGGANATALESKSVAAQPDMNAWRAKLPDELNKKLPNDMSDLLADMGHDSQAKDGRSRTGPPVKVWGNAFSNFDEDDSNDWIIQVRTTDFRAKPVEGTLIYDRTEHGWTCIAKLPGTFPTGWGTAYEGRLGIRTLENVPEDSPTTQKERYYRWDGQRYIPDRIEFTRGG